MANAATRTLAAVGNVLTPLQSVDLRHASGSRCAAARRRMYTTQLIGLAKESTFHVKHSKAVLQYRNQTGCTQTKISIHRLRRER